MNGSWMSQTTSKIVKRRPVLFLVLTLFQALYLDTVYHKSEYTPHISADI